MADQEEAGDPSPEIIEDAVDRALAACDGDPRATIRALLIALDATEQEVAALKIEVARIEAAVSDGYVRGRRRRNTSTP